MKKDKLFTKGKERRRIGVQHGCTISDTRRQKSLCDLYVRPGHRMLKRWPFYLQVLVLYLAQKICNTARASSELERAPLLSHLKRNATSSLETSV